MALQLPKSDPDSNAQFPSCYARIDDIEILLANRSVIITVNYYADPASAATFQPCLPPNTFKLSLAEVAALRVALRNQLYPLLKTRPQFVGAIDAP